MLEELTNIINLPIYTTEGAHLGMVDNIMMDINSNKISALYVRQPNIALVEGSVPVLVPFRWVQAIGDIVILKYFPTRVELGPEEKDELMRGALGA